MIQGATNANIHELVFTKLENMYHHVDPTIYQLQVHPIDGSTKNPTKIEIPCADSNFPPTLPAVVEGMIIEDEQQDIDIGEDSENEEFPWNSTPECQPISLSQKFANIFAKYENTYSDTSSDSMLVTDRGAEQKKENSETPKVVGSTDVSTAVEVEENIFLHFLERPVLLMSSARVVDDDSLKRRESDKDPEVTLEECMEAFLKKEVLTGTERWCVLVYL